MNKIKKIQMTMNAGVMLAFLLLSSAAIGTTATGGYSWQKTHATVLPTGDLEWAPQPFVFVKGDSVKYIDFMDGKDENSGTREQPWKHHPWDAAATGNAKTCKGIHTYVFKRGVIYRGELKAKESGAKGNPIRLTSDPTWGAGEAMFYGSVKLPSAWKRCTASDAPGIPEPSKVWFNDLGKDFDSDAKGTTLSALWRVNGDQAVHPPAVKCSGAA